MRFVSKSRPIVSSGAAACQVCCASPHARARSSLHSIIPWGLHSVQLPASLGPRRSPLPLLDTISPPHRGSRAPVRQRRWIVESSNARVKSRFVGREWRPGWGKKWLSSAASWCRVARLDNSLLAKGWPLPVDLGRVFP